MQTTSLLIRRLLGLLIVPAALALPLVAASAAWAQDEGTAAKEGGDEEDFYRASDPEEPVAGGPKEKDYGPRPGSVTLRLGVFRGLTHTTDLEDHATRPAGQLQAMYSVLERGYWLGLKLGFEFGGIPLHAYSLGSITEAEFTQLRADIETGIDVPPNSHPAYSVGVDVDTFYGAALVSLDFAGSSKLWDAGPVLALGFGQSKIDTDWLCVPGSCTGGVVERESGSASVSHAVLRFGGFISYKLPWFEERFRLGVAASIMYLASSDLPVTMGVDLGLMLEVRF
jgi:hypothetical protein